MPAISATPNSLNFVVPFPSESTVLDREVYLKTNVDYLLTFASAIPGIAIWGTPTGSPLTSPVIGNQCPLIYGYNVSIGSYPTQRTMDTIQVQINNNINTINSADVLPALLRCSDSLYWERENMTASAVDSLQTPFQELMCGFNNNMSSYDLVQGNKFIGNGSFANKITPLDNTTPFINGVPNPITPDPAGNNNQYTGAGTRYFLLNVTSTEPLIAPPFIWNKTVSNKQGIYGIQNLSVVCNYGNLAKAIKISVESGIFGSIAQTGTQPTNDLALPQLVSVSQTVNNAELQMKYITPHGTDVKPLRNVCPLLEFPRFITSGLGVIPNSASTVWVAGNANNPGIGVQGLITPGASIVLSSQTYTFNQIPDKLIIFVRPDSSVRNSSAWNDFVLPIQNINIQFNNHAGILANASQEQLFHMSKEAGSNQDWLEFTGFANVVADRSVAMVSAAVNPIAVLASGSLFVPPYGAYCSASQVSTIGSYLMLDMAKHLEIQEPYYAPGSLGSFQLQFNVTVVNQNWATPYNIALNGITPEIVVIPVNSGIMVTERGQTSCYTGILTKSDVLDASLQEPYSHMDIKRIVGHGHGDSSKALPKHCEPRKRSGTHMMHDGSRMSNRLM